MDDQSKNDPKKNPDPLTGESGSHPIGTGVGAAGGGLTGAAVGAAVGGPVGAAVGAIVGGVAGAYSGKGVAEVVNPTVEDKYWRENHASQEWADADSSYEHYAPAYRTGYQGVIEVRRPAVRADRDRPRARLREERREPRYPVGSRSPCRESGVVAGLRCSRSA